MQLHVAFVLASVSWALQPDVSNNTLTWNTWQVQYHSAPLLGFFKCPHKKDIKGSWIGSTPTAQARIPTQACRFLAKHAKLYTKEAAVVLVSINSTYPRSKTLENGRGMKTTRRLVGQWQMQVELLQITWKYSCEEFLH